MAEATCASSPTLAWVAELRHSIDERGSVLKTAGDRVPRARELGAAVPAFRRLRALAELVVMEGGS